MSCNSPKWIYKEGYYKELNWRMIFEGKEYYQVGCWSNCGVCSSCINKRANEWLVRNYYEEKSHEKKSFITLTYENSPLILVKKDLQDYIKRLRTNLDRSTGEKIRIYSAGEYGSVHKRPHYHIIIYGWQDENATLYGINNKGNAYYKSELIKDTWGKGRISYQKFDSNEITYLSLYNTANETFKREYLLNKEQLKKLEKYAYSYCKLNKNLIQEIDKLRQEVEKSKNGYCSIKEFNTWSKSLGWNNFFDEYANAKEYAFEHYIASNGKKSIGTFPTPTSWVKKLANSGDIQAMEELKRREYLLQVETNEKRYMAMNLVENAAKKKTDILEHKKTGTAVL